MSLRPASAFVVYLQLGIAALWGLFIASSMLFFPVWLVRKLRGNIPTPVYTSYRERNSGLNRAAYRHSTLASITHLVVTVYLVWFGVIGLMTWA